MDRRSFIRAALAGIILPFLPKSLAPAGEAKAGREVFLQRSHLAGFRYYDGERVWHLLRIGERLELKREPENPHDHQAVAVLWKEHRLGYIPRYENATISLLMDQGTTVRAVITELRKSSDPRKKLELEVHLLVE